MSVSTYNATEWAVYRPLIEHLYSERGFTMNQVRGVLRARGFLVNTRMVKTRVLRWNLQKKLHLPEIRTALKLLGPDQSQWPSQEPEFRIRRKVFAFEEILRSFGRRGIQDPFEWVQTTPDHCYEHSSTVELLTPSTTASTEAEDIDQNVSGGALAPPTSPSTALPNPSAPQNGSKETFWQIPNHDLGIGGKVRWSLRDPDIQVHTSTAVEQMQSYCRIYISSSSDLVHIEPEVHHFTTHACFLDHMEEGIALYVSGNTNVAFEKFRLGFAMLYDVLVDVHPMATAIYLLLFCKLTINKVKHVAMMLLRHTIQLARAIQDTPTRFLVL